MKKIGFLILFSLIIQGCNFHPTAENNESSTYMSIAPVQTGNNQIEETRPDDPHIPNCEPLDLKPIKPEEVIKIDDVVQNCKYENAESFYNPLGGGSVYSFGTLYKNGFTIEGTSDPLLSKPFCENRDGTIVYAFPEEEAPGFQDFLKKYKIKEKAYISDIQYHTEDFESIKNNFKCMKDSVCKQLVTLSWGEKHGHFFFYGLLPNNQKEGYSLIFILNDKMYDRNHTYRIPEEGNLNILDSIKKTSWQIYDILQDKMIVKRGVNGEFLAPFKNKEHINWEELDKKSVKEKIPLGKFQLETCEILLGKTP